MRQSSSGPNASATSSGQAVPVPVPSYAPIPSSAHQFVQGALIDTAQRIQIPSLRFETVLISPELAQRLLDRQVQIREADPTVVQRVVNTTRVIQYARQMASGKWLVNGETLVFSNEAQWGGDRILNGQHRLHAVVRSGFAMPFLIVRGIDPDAFATMDQGKPRTIIDLLSMQGLSYRSELAGGGRLAMVYEATGTGYATPSYRPTQIELNDYIVAHADDLIEAAKIANGLGISHKIKLSALAFLVRNRPEREEFFRKLKDGIGLEETDPVRVLRERLIQANNRRAKEEQELLFALTVKAWNAHVRKQPVKVLKFLKTEDFPVVIR